MKKMGITATFVDPLCSEEELDAAFQPNTKVVFGETIANPALTVLDIEKFAKAAHAHGVPLIVDNTFPTPVNCRPFEWGADIVTHSTTKYMDGHGAVLGGAIVDGGKFDWMAHADKFPGLCTPDESYHGITYAERFGKEGAFITKATAQLMRDFGSMQSPMNAYMLNLGLESSMSGCSATAPTAWPSQSSLRLTPRWLTSTTAASSPAPTMRWPRSICRTAAAASFPSAWPAAAKPPAPL